MINTREQDLESGAASRIVYAIDVGSPKNGLAWARLGEQDTEPTGSMDVDVLCQQVIRDIKNERSLAIGFEAPVFLPVARESQNLCRARVGEGSRPWSAGAGVFVSTVVIPVAAWLFDRVATACPTRRPRLTFDAGEWARDAANQKEQLLLVWEAFVSGQGHARQSNTNGVPEHVQDAATAALAFRTWSAGTPRPETAVSTDRPFNTVAAAALWADWAVDHAALRSSSLVLWPSECLGEAVRQHIPSTVT